VAWNFLEEREIYIYIDVCVYKIYMYIYI
jgi:hypothetical protein